MTDRHEPELPFDPPESEPSGPVAGPETDPETIRGSGPKDQPPLPDPSPDLPPDPPPDPPQEDPGPDKDDDEDARMGLLDHLGELRGVLIHSSIAAFAATILCWFWSADLLDLLILPIQDQGVYFTAPNEAFLTRLKLSAVVGLFVVAPFIFFKIYGFVLPGLYQRERKVVTPLLLATTALFYLGVAFAFLVVIPQVISFLMSFGTEVMEPLIGVGPYFNFVSRLCLAFGLVFELPLLIFFLSILGIVNPRMLLRTWRFAIIIIVSLSAMLTPPDVISQVMMAGPVLVLYIGSVLVSIAVTGRRNKKENEDLD